MILYRIFATHTYPSFNVCLWGRKNIVNRFIFFSVCLFILAGRVYTFSLGDAQCREAAQYLADRGEVYMRFYPESMTAIHETSLGVIIDNIVGAEVYAYANRTGFEKFLSHDIPYEILTPPSMTGEKPRMSDYADKDNLQWDAYPTYSGYLSLMDQFAQDYPELCTIVEFGTSVRDRKLLAAKISDNVNDDEKEPSFFYQSTIHGDELCGYMLMLRLIDYLLSNYTSDSRIKQLVDNCEIWINPLCNPDGTYKGGDNTVWESTRFNVNNYDLNRNFPCPSLNGGMNTTENPGGTIQPETRATIDLTDEHHFVLSADFHSGAEIIVYIWGCWSKAHPDKNWWELICNNWVQTVQDNSDPGYLDDNGGYMNAYAWYKVVGERMNYAAYYQQCRSVTVELSRDKKLAESELQDHWDWQYEALLNYLEEVLYGINGTVSDSITGEPLEADVFIENYDQDSSSVSSHLPHGDFYRPVLAGTYSVRFTCEDYYPKTVSVTVQNGQASVLDVKLVSTRTSTEYIRSITTPDNIVVIPTPGNVRIVYNHINPDLPVGIYSLKGTLVREVYPKEMIGIVWDGCDRNGRAAGNGYYFVRIQSGVQSFSQQFVYLSDK